MHVDMTDFLSLFHQLKFISKVELWIYKRLDLVLMRRRDFKRLLLFFKQNRSATSSPMTLMEPPHTLMLN